MTKKKTAEIVPDEETELAVEVSPEPAHEPAVEPAAEPSLEDTEETDEELAAVGPASTRSQRRRMLVLTVLACMAAALVLFSGWYIILRKPISELPLPGIVAEQMPGYGYSFYGIRGPMGIAVSADGSRIYATQSQGTAAVFVFDGQGTQLSTMAPPDTGTDHIFVSVAINPSTGDVYVSDRPTGSLYVYSSDGVYRDTVEPPANLGSWQPLGLAFSAVGHLFVTDATDGRVFEFAPDGALLRIIGEPNQFSFPNAAIADPGGHVYVSDSNNGRLVVLDPSGVQQNVVRRGPGDGDLGLPRGLALDDRNRLYVVDTTDQSVKVYGAPAEEGGPPTYLGQFGSQGTGDGAFSFPQAVATDARGRVYVADWNNDRIQVWTY